MTDFHPYWDTRGGELRVVLVTGALGGIGRAVCEFYHQDKNYYVIGIDRLTEQEDGFVYIDPKTGRQADDRGRQPLSDFIGSEYHQIDLEVSSPYLKEEIDNIFSRFEKADGVQWRLSTVVHCAAYQFCAPMNEGHEMREFDKTMEVNVGVVYYLNLALYPLLKRDQGSVVVVGSVHTVASSAGISLYAISKCALVGLVRNTCIEWARDGIRINMVSPGAVDTPMLRAGLARTEGAFGDIEAKFERLAGRHLTGRVGQPSEVARVVWFLGDSELSSLINGQNIVADGGVSCVLSTEVS